MFADPSSGSSNVGNGRIGTPGKISKRNDSVQWRKSI